MALCGLDLREYRREAFLMHWVDPKSLLRFLLHCHSCCSYCQRGLERGMWPSRCTLPCTSWSSAEGLAWVFWRTVGMCFVLHTGRVMSGVRVLIWDQALDVLGLIPQSQGSLCSALVNAEMATKLRRGDTAQGCRQWIFYLLAAQGLHLHITGFVAVLGISTSYSLFPWSPYRLNPWKFRSTNKSRNNNYVTQNSNENAFYLLPFHVLSYHFWCRVF